MADDFFDLARLAKPTMMPNAPIGAGFSSGVDYNQQQQRFDSAMGQATGLAELRAKMEAMDAEEKSMGAPGRRAKIGLGNLEAEDALADSGTILEGNRQERKNKVDKGKIAEMKASIEKLEPLLNGWDKATSAEKILRKQQAKDMGAVFGKTKLGELDDATFENTMSSLWKAHVMDKRYAEKEMEQIQGKQKPAETRADAAKSIAADKNKLAIILKRMGIDASSAKFSLENVVAPIAQKYAKGGTLTEDEDNLLSYYTKLKTFGTEGRVATAKPTVGVVNGRVTQTPAVAPEQPTLPKKEPKEEETTVLPNGLTQKQWESAVQKYKTTVAAAGGDKNKIAAINAEWKKVFGNTPTPK